MGEEGEGAEVVGLVLVCVISYFQDTKGSGEGFTPLPVQTLRDRRLFPFPSLFEGESSLDRRRQ